MYMYIYHHQQLKFFHETPEPLLKEGREERKEGRKERRKKVGKKESRKGRKNGRKERRKVGVRQKGGRKEERWEGGRKVGGRKKPKQTRKEGRDRENEASKEWEGGGGYNG
jgi:hypothetical protein